MVNHHKLKQYSFIASVYCVTVGFLYLWGYWSSFGINILEYLNLTDILKLSLFPLLSFLVSMVIGAIVGSLIASEKQHPAGGGANSKVGQFLNKHRQPLTFGYWFLVGIIYLYGPPIEKWWILPALICIPLGVNIRQTGIFKDLVPSGAAEIATVSILCYLPFAAYGHGIINANEIAQSTKYQYVEVSHEQLPTQTHAKKEDNLIKLKYLGFVNDYVFLMPMEDKSIIVTQFGKLGTLQIKSSAQR